MEQARVSPIERKRRSPVAYAIVGGILGFLLFVYAFGCYPCAQTRAKVASDSMNMRGMSVWFEDYYIDSGLYAPGEPWSGDALQLAEPLGKSEATFPRQSLHLDGPRSGSATYRFTLAAAGSLLLALALWYPSFRRMESTRLALETDGLCLWLFAFVVVLPIFSNDGWGDATRIGVLLLPTVAMLVWYGDFLVRRLFGTGIPGRVHLIAIILPVILTVQIAEATLLHWHLKSLAMELRGTQSYAYATNGLTSWLLQATGPDGDYDADISRITNISHPEMLELVVGNLNPRGDGFVQYDPTNGSVSDGDIFRTGP